MAAVPLRVYEFRRGWSSNLEKGLEVFYWFCVPTRIAGSVLGLILVIGKKARVPLGVSAILIYKKGDAKFRRFK